MVERGHLSDHPADADPRQVRGPAAERVGKGRRVGGEVAQGVGGHLRVRRRRLAAIAQVVAHHAAPADGEALAERVGPGEHRRPARKEDERCLIIAEGLDAQGDLIGVDGGHRITGIRRWVTRALGTHTSGSPSGTSSIDRPEKKARPPPMTTGTRSIATTSSSPSCRHWAAIVPAVTVTVLGPAISWARVRAAAPPSVTNSKGASGWSRTHCVGTRWVTTTTGASIVWRPPQPSTKSKSVRPQTIAPRPAVHCRQ